MKYLSKLAVLYEPYKFYGDYFISDFCIINDSPFLLKNYNDNLEYKFKLHGSIIGDKFMMLSYSKIISGCDKQTIIGNNVKISHDVIIGHDSIIGNEVIINNGVNINGNCKIGENTEIGSCSVVRDGINIGNNVFIGCGSVVVKDIPNNVIAYGNPCKVASKRDSIIRKGFKALRILQRWI